MLRSRGDDGGITVLVVGFAAVAILLLVVGIAASKVFLARRALSSAADQAALQAAQAVDTNRVYAGGLRCGRVLPLDRQQVERAASASAAASRTDLRHALRSLTVPNTVVRDGVVTVSMSGTVSLPFGEIIGWLDPGHQRMRITETAHARSPVAGC